MVGRLVWEYEARSKNMPGSEGAMQGLQWDDGVMPT